MGCSVEKGCGSQHCSPFGPQPGLFHRQLLAPQGTIPEVFLRSPSITSTRPAGGTAGAVLGPGGISGGRWQVALTVSERKQDSSSQTMSVENRPDPAEGSEEAAEAPLDMCEGEGRGAVVGEGGGRVSG